MIAIYGQKNRRARSRQNLRTLFGRAASRCNYPICQYSVFYDGNALFFLPLASRSSIRAIGPTRNDGPKKKPEGEGSALSRALVCVISSVSPTSAPNMTSLWVRKWARPPPLPKATDPKVCCVGVGGGGGGGGRRRRRQTPANLRRPGKKKKDGEGRYDDDSSRDIVLGRARD